MIKLLENKSIIKFLGIALSILLAIALVPQINIAHGSKDDVADMAADVPIEAADNAAAGEVSALGSEPTENTPSVAQTSSDNDSPGNVPEATSKDLSNNSADLSIGVEENTINSNGTLEYNQSGNYTLTVNGILTSDIKVTNGAVLTINGTGLINGTNAGSVVIVEGANSKVIVGSLENGTSTGPTISGGCGSDSPNNYNNGVGTVGGGIYVKSHATLIMNGGKVTDNHAGAGGGIFVWTDGHFAMYGGEVSKNQAMEHEGGGIFTDAKDSVITGGSIIGNETKTTIDWGGGGIYVNNNGTLKISSVLITNNTAAGLGGGIAGCPHAKIVIGKKETTGVGQLENSAAVFKNIATGTSYPLNTVLRLNVPKSVVDAGKRVPSGDFFITGMNADEIAKLREGTNTGYIVNDKLTYPGDKTYTLENGDYASKQFKTALAQDYYCTLASYIAEEDVLKRSEGEAFAWRGFEVGIPPVTGTTVDGTGLWAREMGIPVGMSYESHDATLCLTNTAEGDAPNVTRAVIIKDNISGTHGGGIACNGAIKFGKFDTEQKTTVNPYTIHLNKKIVNSLGKEIKNLENDIFNFELIDKDDPNKKYSASTDSSGALVFAGLPGYDEEGHPTKHFTLKEQLTAQQSDMGFVSSIPSEGVDVEVCLSVSKEVATYKEKDDTVLLTATTYTTKVDTVTIGGVATNEVTNNLNLKTTVKIPVKKIADGIAGETFTFGLKDVTQNIGSLVDQANGKITLKSGVNLENQAITDPDKTAAITLGDSVASAVEAFNESDFSFTYTPSNEEETHWYVIAEQPGTTAGVVYDTTAYLVKITTTLLEDDRSLSTSQAVYKTVPDSNELQEVTGAIGVTFTNVATPKGTWQFQADKFFYGLGEPRDCSFTMKEIKRAPEAGESLANVLALNENPQQWTVNIAAVDFKDGHADIVFPKITYEQQGEGEGFQNDVGDHFYVVTEDGDDAVKDTTAYVVKVTVTLDETNSRNLTATETTLGYADDLDSTLNPLVLPEDTPTFYNTDTYNMISAASYSVYAASGEPVDQVCYVDPKIVKNLEGRAIKSGEFAFKLIQVANYNDTEGELISATTNDEFGMVDFDKANNVSGDFENPSCLAYTAPGTYYYRVIEDTSNGGMKDQSVLYSDQVITFTTVIEKVDENGEPVAKPTDPGKLVCTDMYYGYWDKAANENVRFDEQYVDYATQPDNIGDMTKLDPNWHPTITNKARPMDLQVRKTSVTDRDEGLVGATYALYMVNENVQGDIWLAEATSEEGGWITYKDVSLSTNNLYYFKETAAPAGHTVSEFRSPYFYLVEDAGSPNGYALDYSDTKYFEKAQTQAAAANDTVQPGHSADGNVLLTYDRDGGVYDEATQVEVNKLDTRTHEWVEGAKLVIIEKESGKEVNSWTSGKAPEKLHKTLNVDTTYILREVEAPGEYRLANDVEFVIDNYGNVAITKGTENGNAELSDNTITLYDTMMDAEEIEQRERENIREVPLGTRLAQTGDMIPLMAIGVVALASLIALAMAARRRRTEKDGKN